MAKIEFRSKLILLATLAWLGATSNLAAQSWGEYTLYSLKNSTKAYMIDLNGTLFHTWTFASSKPTGYSIYLLPGQVLLRTVARQGNSFQGGPICGEVQKVDWSGNVTWDFVYSTTDYCTHHDICPMPNGNVLLIAYESKSASQVSAAGCSQSIVMWPDKIVEIKPTGSTTGDVVWEWHAWDHLCQNLYPSKSNYVSSIVEHPELLNINYKTQKDWMHVNGIDYNEYLDQIIFSSHNMNEFFVIDHSTTTAEAASHAGGRYGKGGDFLYRWGNPASYQASGTTNFDVVHDAHWVPYNCPKAGQMVGFNNQGGPGGKSCIDIVEPPYSANGYNVSPGTANLPATYSWRHVYSGSPTSNEGNSQQLPNGNMLINISFSAYIYEIDPNQNVVWSKSLSGTNTSAFRYSDCYVNGLGYVNAAADKSKVCTGGQVSLSAEAIGGSNYTYQWWSVPVGFSSTLQNPVVVPQATTMYYVSVTSGACTETDSVRVVVVPLPDKPVITYTNDSLFSNYSQGNQWYLNGSALNGATNAWLKPTSPGNYQVQYTDANACGSALSDSFVYTQLQETTSGNRFFLNPNPAKNQIILSNASASKARLQIFNTMGQCMMDLDVRSGEAIGITQLLPGIYIARLESGGTLKSQTIIVQ